ncbi:hypothetical protein FDUTEX481_03711 [Tolypothrix sp. PCC 7601]|nr:hypothetical protein FDUTEX481_03711 [Tolypothrix sp. PCC 7601]
MAGRKPTPPTLRYLRRLVLVFWFCYQLIFLTELYLIKSSILIFMQRLRNPKYQIQNLVKLLLQDYQ